MVLVPQETLENVRKQHNTENDGLSSQVDEFKMELDKVLQNAKLPADELFKIYTQLFARYSNLDMANKQPMKVLLQKSENDLSEEVVKHDQFIWPITVLDGLPKNKRNQAASLIDEIKNNPRIKIDKIGEIIIDGTVIPNSHIIDLIHDFTRQRKSAKPAVGSDVFAKVLKDSNVPREYIGNIDRFNILKSATKYKQEESPKASFKVDTDAEDGWFDAQSVGNKTLLSDSPEKTPKPTRSQKQIIRRKIKYYMNI